jgi:hypothetical protein
MTLRIEPTLLLRTIENLAEFHREHERFYAAAPREQAVELQRQARTLHYLADRSWHPHEPADGTTVRPDGVLFLPGPNEPSELERMAQKLRGMGEEALATAEWMCAAMQSSWDAATELLDLPALADLLGERHRIIANDWQAAAMATIVGRLLQRAADILARVDLGPEAMRADLAGAGVAPRRLHSAAELITRAADLLSEAAGLVHDNERRWRTFHHRVRQLLVTHPAGPDAGL